MKIDHIVLWELKIPFKMKVDHGSASRSFCDSIIVMVKSRNLRGYGEIIIRDYVSGSLGSGKERLTNASKSIKKLISPLLDTEFNLTELQFFLEHLQCQKNELPLLCGIETALYDLSCRHLKLDIYQLLQLRPINNQISYGGVLPIVPKEVSRKLLEQCLQLQLEAVRVKLSNDPTYNSQILQLCRQILGFDFLIRVDANCSWTKDSIVEHLNICEKYSVLLIEQPMRPIDDSSMILSDQNKKRGFQFMADESILTMEDLDVISERQSYQFLNLRLSKNGGLIRVLKLANAASSKGIDYQLGCHVGESGILSSVGRVAASLLPNAVYVDGSYDDYLLSENITTENFSFGLGGNAIIRSGEGYGYRVDEKKLANLSIRQQVV